MNETVKNLVNGLDGIRRSILLVEDDKYDRELALIAFQSIRDRFQIDVALNGREAKEHLVRQDCDIIFLDLKLPVEDGVSVLQYCKVHAPKIPIVIVTAYPDSELMKRAPIMSYVGMVTKPLTKEIVIEILRKHRLLV
ncbi:MAG: response regulator [Patescibacteria group bacterium]|nr:response regulator [Patescibacteria group bacterium]